ncbi:MAG: FIST N-terminal domain-containing protein [bacterium]|nr:FIST N-terminal domain-containing protein [bacterium]MDZ4284803.1 FIST N-terminal domain-containing protein [Patescibacteria group bacterium]
MSLIVGVGTAKEHDAHQAGFAAAQSALERAGVERPTQLLVFASTLYDQEALVRGVRDASGNAPLVGCSATGILTNEGPVDQTVAVVALESDSVTFASGMGLMKNGARAAGALVGQEIRELATGELVGLLLFANMLRGGAAEVLGGLQSVLGANIPAAGVAASDELTFERTFQYRDALVGDDALVGCAISGECVLGIGVEGGWIPVGIPQRVTRAEGTRVFELEGRRAASIYEDYFGEDLSKLRAEPLAHSALGYPLGVRTGVSDEYLIRNPLRAEEDGSLTLAAAIPEGARVRLMIGSKEKALTAACTATEGLMERLKRSHVSLKLLLVFESISRKKLLGAMIKDETNAILDIVGRDTPLLGIASYGEYAPAIHAIGGGTAPEPTLFHNGTITIVGIGTK